MSNNPKTWFNVFHLFINQIFFKFNFEYINTVLVFQYKQYKQYFVLTYFLYRCSAIYSKQKIRLPFSLENIFN